MSDVEMAGADAVLERLTSFPERIAVRLQGVMRVVGGALEDRVRANLSGRILHARSGRLRSSVVFDVDQDGDTLAATVGVAADVPYAAFQEYGWSGVESVRASLRTVRQAFGRPIAPRTVAVKAHSRRVDYPAHSFLRSALAELEPDARARIEAAVADEADR